MESLVEGVLDLLGVGVFIKVLLTLERGTEAHVLPASGDEVDDRHGIVGILWVVGIAILIISEVIEKLP